MKFVENYFEMGLGSKIRVMQSPELSWQKPSAHEQKDKFCKWVGFVNSSVNLGSLWGTFYVLSDREFGPAIKKQLQSVLSGTSLLAISEYSERLLKEYCSEEPLESKPVSHRPSVSRMPISRWGRVPINLPLGHDPGPI